ncbi:MAG TPA: hypothetical protein VHS59_14070 [Bacillota bacterium]|nr:hypothetical protein [Bacillota bacterium]
MITSKELMLVQDNIEMGKNCLTFIQACAQSASDQQLKSLCQSMATEHQKDIQTLTGLLTNQTLQ